jgi:tetratricopeptide (TPR) repeat protein
MRVVLVYCLSAFLLTAALHIDARGADHIPDSLERSLNQITAYIYNDRFDRAAEMIDSLASNDIHPVFHLSSRAVLYQSRMMAAESDFLEDPLMTVLDSLERAAEHLLETNHHDSALAYCYLGHAHSFRALYQGRTGQTYGALKKGLKARNAYSKAWEIDSTFYDIAFGLGSYRYWKSVKTKAINWTPLFKNERQNGIDLLRLAADSAEVSAETARAALIYVYINEKRYAEAIRLADQMRRRYPRGMTFLWALGEAYYKMGDDQGAVDIYENLYRRLWADPGNYYNIIEVASILSDSYRFLGTTDSRYVGLLQKLQDEISGADIPDQTRKRQKKKLRSILKPH